jgi:hypothetical protein
MHWRTGKMAKFKGGNSKSAGLVGGLAGGLEGGLEGGQIRPVNGSQVLVFITLVILITITLSALMWTNTIQFASNDSKIYVAMTLTVTGVLMVVYALFLATRESCDLIQ